MSTPEWREEHARISEAIARSAGNILWHVKVNGGSAEQALAALERAFASTPQAAEHFGLAHLDLDPDRPDPEDEDLYRPDSEFQRCPHTYLPGPGKGEFPCSKQAGHSGLHTWQSTLSQPPVEICEATSRGEDGQVRRCVLPKGHSHRDHLWGPLWP